MPEFTIDENAPILVEFAVRPGAHDVGLVGDNIEELTEKSTEALDSAMNAIHKMARRVTETVEALAKRPSQVEVAFGLKLDAKTGALIAKAGVEANLNIKLVWDFKGATSENG
jgi:hypothetical protein